MMGKTDRVKTSLQRTLVLFLICSFLFFLTGGAKAAKIERISKITDLEEISLIPMDIPREDMKAAPGWDSNQATSSLNKENITVTSLESEDPAEISEGPLLLKAPTARKRISQRLINAKGKGFPFGELQTYERCHYTAKLGPEKRDYFNASLDYGLFDYKGHTYYRAIFTIKYSDKKMIEDALMGREGAFFYPIFCIRSVEDATGKLARIEKIVFDRHEGTARVIRDVLDPEFTEKYESSKSMDITIKVPRDTYSAFMLDYGYRVADLKVGDETFIHYISRQGMLAKMKIAVNEIVEIETPLKTFFCYKIVQMPSSLYMKHLKFFFSFPKLIQDQLMPKIVFYYSVDNPHRLVQYYGYKDFGPASLKPSQAGLLFEDYMEVRISQIEPLDTDRLPHSELLMAEIAKYDLFKQKPPPVLASRDRDEDDSQSMNYAELQATERCHYEATIGENRRLYGKGHIDYGMIDWQDKKYHRAVSTMIYPDRKVVDDIVMGKEGNYFSPVYYSRTIENQQGRLVRSEDISFFPKSGQARIVRDIADSSFTDDYEPDKNLDVNIELPNGTYAPLMLDMGYRMADLKVGNITNFNAISHHGVPVRLKASVAEIVEIETPMKTFFCYKVVQKPSKVFRNYLKELWGVSKFTWNQFNPEIALYYSINKPHRLIYYNGCSDLGPASPNRKEVDVVAQSFAGTQLTSIDPITSREMANHDVFLERIRRSALGNAFQQGRKGHNRFNMRQ